MRRLAAALGWATFAGALVVAWRANDEVDADTREITTFLAYALDQGVRFTLEAGERQVRLDTWLVLPAGWGSDARATAPYCLSARATGPDGELLLEQERWLSSRAGFTEEESGRRRPVVTLAEATGEPSLGRLLMLDLGDRAPRGGTLELGVCAAPSDARVLLIAYRLGERDRLSRYRIARGLSPRAQRRYAASVGAFEWAAVPEDWREELVETRWDRMGALPVEGRALPTVRLYTADSHVSWEDVPAWGLPLMAGAAAAWNVVGPAFFEGSWARLDGAAAQGVGGELRVVHADGRVDLRPLPPSSEIQRFALPAGLHSVQIALPTRSEPRLLRVRTADAETAWGDPARLPVEDDGFRRVGVDLRRVELFRVDQDTDPLQWRLDPEIPARLLLRARLPPGALPGFGEAPAELTRTARVRLLAEDGSELSRWEIPVPGVPSPFERYVQGDTIRSARVSEQVAHVLLPPAGAARLSLEADGPIDASLRVLLPDGALVPNPRYALPEGAEVQGRYEPDVLNPWLVRAPEDFEALARTERVVAIDAQVRLEPEGSGGRRGARKADWRSLSLELPFELLAQRDPGATGSGARARLGREPTPVLIGQDGRLSIDYRAPLGLVGAAGQLTVGGQTRELKLRAAGGRLVFGELPPGATTASLDLDGLFLAPPTSEGDWQVRRFYRLDPGVPLSVPWPGGEGRLGLHVCGASPGASLAWTVQLPEGEAAPPASRDARSGARALKRESSALPLSFAEGELSCAAPVLVPLWSALGERALTLSVRLEEASGPAWLRLTTTRWLEDEDAAPTFGRRGAP